MNEYSACSFSDLAAERRRAADGVSGVIFNEEIFPTHTWERLVISSEEGAKSIGRPMGKYDTLTTPRLDTLESFEVDELASELSEELTSILDAAAPSAEKILVAGLGNRDLTPDSVGPRAAALVNPTMHLKLDLGFIGSGHIKRIAVLSPGVREQSGIDSSLAVMALCACIRPDALIAIDSLATVSESRLGRTVQISDTGIQPGSGIGGCSAPLCKDTLGVPVIAIGVPTVISSRALCKSGDNGGIKDPEGSFVSLKEIDAIVDTSARLIALGINRAFGAV